MYPHIETAPKNHHGERVVAHQLLHVSDGQILYRCQDKHWQADLAAWGKLWREGKRGAEATEPMPEGHCMFLTPLQYGCVPLGETRACWIRRALWKTIAANLDGWDRDMRKTYAGLRQLARIVRASVNAKMEAEDIGASPYLACILAGV